MTDIVAAKQPLIPKCMEVMIGYLKRLGYVD